MRKTRIVAALAVGALGLGSPGWAAGAHGSERRAVEVLRLGSTQGSWLGVTLEDVDPGQAAGLKLDSAQGARVTQVEHGSPAEKAGLAAGDVLLRFDGERVRSAAQLARLVRETPPGRSVALEAWRDGGARRLTAELATRSSRERADAEDDETFDLRVPEPGSLPEAPRFHWRGLQGLEGIDLAGGPRRLGIAFQTIEGQLARYFKVDGGRGLLVTEVDEGSPAAKAGLRAGDVLLSFDQKQLEDAGDLREAVRRAESGKGLLVDVLREGRKLQLSVTLAEPRRGIEGEKPI